VKTALVIAAVAAAAAFAWWEGGLHQSQVSAHVGVLALIALGFSAALVAGRRRQAIGSAAWVEGPLSVRRHWAENPAGTLGAVVWVVLVLAAIGWDLNSFVHQSHNLPTLSSIFGHLTSTRGGRASMVALWLALGTALATGWRTAR
jgi:hypothetical protein